MLDSNPTTAITETRSWTNDTSASFRQRWTPRTAVQMDYGFNKRAYKTAIAFDSRTHRGGVGYERLFGRSTGIRGSYRYSDMVALDFEGRPRPVQSHAADLGFSYGRNLSRTRRVSFSGGAGAEYVDAILEATREGFTYWVPSGYSTALLDLGRSWTILANYRRGVSMLQGLTPRPSSQTGKPECWRFYRAPNRRDGYGCFLERAGWAGRVRWREGSELLGNRTVRFAVTQWWSAVFTTLVTIPVDHRRVARLVWLRKWIGPPYVSDCPDPSSCRRQLSVTEEAIFPPRFCAHGLASSRFHRSAVCGVLFSHSDSVVEAAQPISIGDADSSRTSAGA